MRQGKKVTDAAIYGNILIDNNGTAEGITTAVPPFDGSGIYIDFGSEYPFIIITSASLVQDNLASIENIVFSTTQYLPQRVLEFISVIKCC